MKEVICPDSIHVDVRGDKTATVSLSFPATASLEDVFIIAHRLGAMWGVGGDRAITVTHPFPFAGTETDLVSAWHRFVMGEPA